MPNAKKEAPASRAGRASSTIIRGEAALIEWSLRLGISEEELRDAIHLVGSRLSDVKRYLADSESGPDIVEFLASQKPRGDGGRGGQSGPSA